MDVWVKLNTSTAGKDKLFRFVQYLSRMVWHNLESRKNVRDTVARLKIIETSFSSFRKLLRLGKSLEVLHGALRTLHLPDVVLRITLTLSRIYQSLFLLADHIIWVGRAGLWNIDKERWSRVSNKLWLGSIILNLLRDAYEVLNITRRRARCLAPPMFASQGVSGVRQAWRAVPVVRLVTEFAEEHRDVFWDCVKNLCDFWIPLTHLGHANLSAGTVGFLGSVSSVAGLVAVLDPLAKLAPA